MSEPKKFKCANGAMLEVPIFEVHERGTNWMAAIDVDPTKPGGFSRRWIDRGKGVCFYLTEKVAVFEAVEFGADYTTGAGTRKPKRWHGVVVAKTDDYLAIEEVPSAKEAVLRAQAKRISPSAVIDAFVAQRAGLAAKLAEVDAIIAELKVTSPASETFEAYAQRLIGSFG